MAQTAISTLNHSDEGMFGLFLLVTLMLFGILMISGSSSRQVSSQQHQDDISEQGRYEHACYFCSQAFETENDLRWHLQRVYNTDTQHYANFSDLVERRDVISLIGMPRFITALKEREPHHTQLQQVQHTNVTCVTGELINVGSGGPLPSSTAPFESRVGRPYSHVHTMTLVEGEVTPLFQAWADPNTSSIAPTRSTASAIPRAVRTKRHRQSAELREGDQHHELDLETDTPDFQSWQFNSRADSVPDGVAEFQSPTPETFQVPHLWHMLSLFDVDR